MLKIKNRQPEDFFLVVLHRDQGFTLIELMMTMVIAGFIIFAIYTTYMSQQRIYLVQDQVTEMQQNIRAGLDILSREIRMAGYHGKDNITHASCNIGGAGAPVSPGVLAVNANQLDISMDSNTDGDCADPGENLTYALYTAADGIQKLGRRDNTATAPAFQAVAENFDGLEFRYLDENGAVTTTPSDVSFVQVSLLARVRRPDDRFRDNVTYTTPSGTTWTFNDNLRRRFFMITMQCRNAGF
ncbi:prepilin-type N-terminal cleavage/methylation domain-containing protein [Thermodesulfobacteriota bacterium B35]